MKEPRWLPDAAVRAIHRRQLAEHGGLDGIRDPGMLSSALARPKNLFIYGSPPPDLAALAASYAYGIARNHPFVDGNKRTAFVACDAFLRLNGATIAATQLEKYELFLGLAEGNVSEEELAEWIRTNMTKWKRS
jgi:death on curing protein